MDKITENEMTNAKIAIFSFVAGAIFVLVILAFTVSTQSVYIHSDKYPVVNVYGENHTYHFVAYPGHDYNIMLNDSGNQTIDPEVKSMLEKLGINTT